MSPRIIRYCWFGHCPIPEHLQKCMDSWKKMMPSYEIRRWDETTFDVESSKWTSGAYAAKKYAFVSDYVRLYALYKYGGIYLDTDVRLEKSIEGLQVKHTNFMGFENGTTLTSAIICAESHNQIIEEFLHHYQGKTFSSDIVASNEANVKMMTELFVNYGMVADNMEQDVAGFHIFPQTYFCPLDFWHNKHFSEQTHAVHYFEASWLEEDTIQRIKAERRFIYKVRTWIFGMISKLRQNVRWKKGS